MDVDSEVYCRRRSEFFRHMRLPLVLGLSLCFQLSSPFQHFHLAVITLVVIIFITAVAEGLLQIICYNLMIVIAMLCDMIDILLV